MLGIFRKLIEVATLLGSITCAHMYDSNFMTIEGSATDGRKFSITLNFNEGDTDEAVR